MEKSLYFASRTAELLDHPPAKLMSTSLAPMASDEAVRYPRESLGGPALSCRVGSLEPPEEDARKPLL